MNKYADYRKINSIISFIITDFCNKKKKKKKERSNQGLILKYSTLWHMTKHLFSAAQILGTGRNSWKIACDLSSSLLPAAFFPALIKTVKLVFNSCSRQEGPWPRPSIYYFILHHVIAEGMEKSLLWGGGVPSGQVSVMEGEVG